MLQLSSTVTLIAVGAPFSLPALLVMLGLFWGLYRYFIASMRQAKRLEAVSRYAGCCLFQHMLFNCHSTNRNAVVSATQGAIWQTAAGQAPAGGVTVRVVVLFASGLAFLERACSELKILCIAHRSACLSMSAVILHTCTPRRCHGARGAVFACGLAFPERVCSELQASLYLQLARMLQPASD